MKYILPIHCVVVYNFPSSQLLVNVQHSVNSELLLAKTYLPYGEFHLLSVGQLSAAALVLESHRDTSEG